MEASKQKRRHPFGSWVAHNAHILMEGGKWADGTVRPGYEAKGSDATRVFAALRKQNGHRPGLDPQIEAWTIPDPQDKEVAGDVHDWAPGPTRREQAAHDALTLYAIHQRSIRDKNMHTDDYVSIGTAVGRLARTEVSDADRAGKTLARIIAASTHSMLITRLRSLVMMLNRPACKIPINYGLLAGDLLSLSYGGDVATKVRERWGRDMQHAYDVASHINNKKTSSTNNDNHKE